MMSAKNPKLDEVLDLNALGCTPNSEDSDFRQCNYIYSEDIDLDTTSMNILHWNIRGLLNKQDGITRLIRSLGGINKVNVVCLNETWLRSETSNMVSIPGYNFVSKHHKGKKGGGLGILISKEMHFRDLSMDLNLDTEIEYMTTEIKCKQNSVIVVNMYR